jgi:hypothetical protein
MLAAGRAVLENAPARSDTSLRDQKVRKSNDDT